MRKNQYEYLYAQFDASRKTPSTPRPGKYFYIAASQIDCEYSGALDIFIASCLDESKKMELVDASYYFDEYDFYICGWKQMDQAMAKKLDAAIARHDANVAKQKQLAKQKAAANKEKERQLYEKLKKKYG